MMSDADGSIPGRHGKYSISWGQLLTDSSCDGFFGLIFGSRGRGQAKAAVIVEVNDEAKKSTNRDQRELLDRLALLGGDTRSDSPARDSVVGPLLVPVECAMEVTPGVPKVKQVSSSCPEYLHSVLACQGIVPKDLDPRSKDKTRDLEGLPDGLLVLQNRAETERPIIAALQARCSRKGIAHVTASGKIFVEGRSSNGK
jgi:hypothetical protein